MNQKLIYFLLFILAGGSVVFGQSTFKDLEQSDLYSLENEIINGEIWTYQKKYVGHPFLNENEWYKGHVEYKGIRYDNVAIRFDIHEQDLIIFKEVKGKSRSLKLNPNFVTHFSIINPALKDTVFFEKMSLPGLNYHSIFAKVYEAKSAFYIEYKKIINNVVSDKYTGEYLLAPSLFAKTNTHFVEFDSKSDFINLFAPRQNGIKKFMRKNRIKFKRKTPENLIPVFQYFDSIKDGASVN